MPNFFTRVLGCSTKEVEAALERAEPDELIPLEGVLVKPMLDHFAVQLFHPGGQVVLKPEIRQNLREPVEINAVIPRDQRQPRQCRQPWRLGLAAAPGRRRHGPDNSPCCLPR